MRQIDIAPSVLKSDTQRLINQIWKLIPMKEKSEDWQSQLITIIEEIYGLNQVFYGKLDFLILLSKLEGLQSPVCEDFMVFRKTVFSCINLLVKVTKEDG